MKKLVLIAMDVAGIGIGAATVAYFIIAFNDDLK